ncbi:MAG: ABC transporter substrate-binding protein [Propionibacteriaceae bacterium]|jgi:oligopeptide transport system substrate-binding protein|nr:ABC transporter substrate-binding protein [Propionibacteriaceae bacterium]
MRAITPALIGVASLALLASGCASDGGTNNNGGETGGATEISIRGCTPENKLIASNTNEVCGGNVLQAVTSKLVYYNPDNSAPELDIAESIESPDAQNFTVKLKQGYKFHDGTEVKAKNFVDAWNWAAYGTNTQLASSFFEPIEGYDKLQCGVDKESGEADCTKNKPEAETMSGLKVVDDYTFTIKTTTPTSNLEVRLGYTAFAPQPDSFFADTSQGKTEFGTLPVGAGPYKIVSNTATEMVLEKFADYSGAHAGSVDKVTFRIYNDMNTAYNDVVANNLDLTDQVPADQLVNDQWKNDLVNEDGTPRYGTKETGVIQVMTFSPIDDQLKSIDMRDALSMALDREQITKQIFNGARTPATGWVSPVVDGYKAGACTACVFDPTKAKELYEKAGGYKGTLTIAVNGDGGHKEWAEAVCNQWKNNLGVTCAVEATPNFQTLRKGINNRELKGLYRGGWQMDYPSIENFLTPIYSTGASSNDGDFSDKKFDQLLKDAAAETDLNKANELYQEAERILGEKMPSIPQWYQSSQYGYSSKIAEVKMTPFSTFDLSSIKLK